MVIDNLKKVLKEKSLVFGSERTIKQMKLGKAKKVFLANNCPDRVKKRIKHYAKLSNINVVELDKTNEEVGTICKKRFLISVLCS